MLRLDLRNTPSYQTHTKVLQVQPKMQALTGKTKNWNFVYDGNNIFFRIVPLFGIFPLTKDEKGVICFKYVSIVSIYSIILYLAELCISCFLLKSIIKNLKTINFSIQESIMYSCYLTFPTLTTLPILSFFEMRKLAAHLNDWQDFQDRFEITTRSRIPQSPFRGAKSLCITVGTLLIQIFLIWTSDFRFINNYQGIEIINYYFISLCNSYGTSILATYIYTWTLLTGSVKKAATFIIQDVESLHWKSSKSLKGHILLWLHLRQLCLTLGNVLNVSYLALFALIYATVLPFLFLGVSIALQGQIGQLIASLLTAVIISVLAEHAHNVVEEVGPKFKANLTSLLLSGRAAGEEEELLTFIQTIADNPPFICTGGFFYLDRFVNIPLFSSIITYLIIMVQLLSPNC